MHTHTKKHRHFVVAPLLAVAILASSADTLLTSSLSEGVPEHSAADNAVHEFGVGAQAYKFPETVFSVVDGNGVLEQGSLLVRSTGIARVQIGTAEAIGLTGSMHITRYDDRVSVAGITAPVLVRSGSRFMVVPVGRQWRNNGDALPTLDAGYALWSGVRTTQELPKRFYGEQLRLAANMQPISEPDFLRPIPFASVAKVTHALLLPTAESRARRSQHGVQFRALHTAAMQGDTATVEGLLRDEDVFSQQPGQDAVAHILQATPMSSAVRIPLLSALSDNQDLWLLASVHPDYSAETWTLIGADVDAEARVLALLTFPDSDFFLKSKGEFVVDQWQAAVAEHLRAQTDPLPFLSQLVERTAKAARRMDAVGYPARARQFAEAVEQLSQPYALLLTEDMRLMIEGLSAMEFVSLPADEPAPEPVEETQEQTEEAPEVEPEPEVVLSPNETEAEARAILSEAEALYTIETTLSAVGPNTVQVRNIIFSGAEKDRSFDFSLNVIEGKVRHIQEGDQSYPYPMWVEDFVQWARQ